jgi:hypothetical protein
VRLAQEDRASVTVLKVQILFDDPAMLDGLLDRSA